MIDKLSDPVKSAKHFVDATTKEERDNILKLRLEESKRQLSSWVEDCADDCLFTSSITMYAAEILKRMALAVCNKTDGIKSGAELNAIFFNAIKSFTDEIQQIICFKNDEEIH